jgi:DNA-binding response OmpR family regulator
MNQTRSKKLILVIEDEKTLLNIMRTKLQHAGFAVETAEDGATGLDLIRKKEPDLVLLDILLPVMNGLELLEKLQEEGRLPSLPVIVISNSGQPVELGKITKMGVRGYLIKINFSPREVLAKVEQVLAAEENGRSASSIAPKARPETKVLIVEDDVILVDLLERKFRQEGWEVFIASNVKEARRILKENPIDVILLDIVLPDIDGFTFLGELKQDKGFSKIPVIVISNLGQREEIEKGIRMGAVDYVIKANTLPKEILEKVKAAFSKK